MHLLVLFTVHTCMHVQHVTYKSVVKHVFDETANKN